eukprot:364450-Chlamydomonas_euryale.AAC.3
MGLLLCLGVFEGGDIKWGGGAKTSRWLTWPGGCRSTESPGTGSLKDKAEACCSRRLRSLAGVGFLVWGDERLLCGPPLLNARQPNRVENRLRWLLERPTRAEMVA